MVFRLAGLLLGLASFLPSASLDDAVQNRIRSTPGKVSLYAKNLATGATFGVLPDEPVRTASTIKLAILVECFTEAAERKVKLDEPIEVTAEEKVSGSGILQEFSNGLKLPLRDVMDLMIVMSDNTATNLILNRIGADAVNARMAKMGLVQTRSMRKILGDGNKLKPAVSGVSAEGAKPENRRFGIGRSSPHEMVQILEGLYKGETVSKSVSDEMLTILKRQRDREGLGRDLKDLEIANKSGALDHLRSDVGIIYSKGGPIAIAITVEDIPEINWTPENPGLLAIADLSGILVQGLAATL